MIAQNEQEMRRLKNKLMFEAVDKAKPGDDLVQDMISHARDNGVELTHDDVDNFLNVVDAGGNDE